VSRQFKKKSRARAPEANPSLRGQFSWPLLRLLPPRQRFAYYRGGFHSNATIKAAAAPTLLSYLMYILDIKECSLLFYVPSLWGWLCIEAPASSALVYYIQPHSRTIQRRMDCCECVARKREKYICGCERSAYTAAAGADCKSRAEEGSALEMGMSTGLLTSMARFCRTML
jgi:hypothetical protein